MESAALEQGNRMLLAGKGVVYDCQNVGSLRGTVTGETEKEV